MQKRRLWQHTKLVVLVAAIVVLLGGTGTVMAQTSSSPNYQVTETQIGGGSSLDSCSQLYCAQVSIGEVSDGVRTNSSTASFRDTNDTEPVLEMIIETGESNLGVLTTQQTATKTTLVQVRSYLSGGYTLQIIGDPPKFEGYTLRTPSTPTASVPGTEQFAMNAVANDSPNIGADPAFGESDIEDIGVINDQYDTPNLFKYASEDTIARSEAESARIDYTISMIVNIASGTPAGHYSGDFLAVLVPLF